MKLKKFLLFFCLAAFIISTVNISGCRRHPKPFPKPKKIKRPRLPHPRHPHPHPHPFHSLNSIPQHLQQISGEPSMSQNFDAA